MNTKRMLILSVALVVFAVTMMIPGYLLGAEESEVLEPGQGRHGQNGDRSGRQLEKIDFLETEGALTEDEADDMRARIEEWESMGRGVCPADEDGECPDACPFDGPRNFELGLDLRSSCPRTGEADGERAENGEQLRGGTRFGQKGLGDRDNR